MKFIIDAQLSYRLAKFIANKGFDVIHTDDLPNRERTSDNEIRSIAKRDNRIVISKDKDFYDSHLLQKSPAKLLLISTGNIVNRELLEIFENNWSNIVVLFSDFNLLELTNSELIAHGSL
jgi:predicted nuclease of predicted toxin-antitoxin system